MLNHGQPQPMARLRPAFHAQVAADGSRRCFGPGRNAPTAVGRYKPNKPPPSHPRAGIQTPAGSHRAPHMRPSSFPQAPHMHPSGYPRATSGRASGSADLAALNSAFGQLTSGSCGTIRLRTPSTTHCAEMFDLRRSVSSPAVGRGPSNLPGCRRHPVR
jgi:hypothetical protein